MRARSQHNKFVCDDLRAKGAMFIEDLAEVPAVRRSSSVRLAYQGRSRGGRQAGLEGVRYDLPLVTKGSCPEVGKMRRDEREIVMISHKGILKWKAPSARHPAGYNLVETVADVESLPCRRRDESWRT